MPDDLDKIPNDHQLLRRIHPKQFVAVGGERRLSSAAFRDPELSVDNENMLTALGKDWPFSLRAHPKYGLVRFQAHIAREADQIIEHNPVPADSNNPLKENPAHCEIIGKKTGSICNKFRDTSAWVKEPEEAA